MPRPPEQRALVVLLVMITCSPMVMITCSVGAPPMVITIVMVVAVGAATMGCIVLLMPIAAVMLVPMITSVVVAVMLAPLRLTPFFAALEQLVAVMLAPLRLTPFFAALEQREERRCVRRRGRDAGEIRRGRPICPVRSVRLVGHRKP